MIKTLVDTSVVVQALLTRQEFHARALPALTAALTDGNVCCVSTHTIAEIYAALTRPTVAPDLPIAQARYLIERVVIGSMKVIELTTDDYRSVIAQSAALGLRSGSVYDGLHVQAGRRIGADRILTFNLRHFERFWPDHGGVIRSP